VYGPDVHIRIVAAATGELPEADSQWSHRLLAEQLTDDGISASQIGRILADLDLKPHRVRGWLTRRADPNFFIKAAEICDLYLHQPAGSVVVCLDEKTAIGARSRKHPEQRAAPGRVARREFEYIRHGTISIIAALDVHNGEVLTERIIKNDSVTFIRVLNMLDANIDPNLTVHLVLDNGSSHTSKATKKWLREHPRFQPHYTQPTRPGWTRPSTATPESASTPNSSTRREDIPRTGPARAPSSPSTNATALTAQTFLRPLRNCLLWST
jgi:hypothetical protein